MKHTLLTFLFVLVSISSHAQWWEPQISGVNVNLNDVYCITENIVVIVGDGGTILKTLDGGAHWIQKTSGTTNFLRKVQFINNTIGYAVGSGGTLLKTIDGGESWNSVATGLTTELSGLSVINENTFYISGNQGLIKKTNDGGVTFIDQSYNQNSFFKNIQFLNEDIGYASSFDYYGADSNAFIKTTDGGLTWTSILDQNTSCFYFINENIGFIRNGNGLRKTIDGGLTLTDLMVFSDGETADIFALNENISWNVGNNFTLCNCASFCIHKANFNNEPNLQETENCYADSNGGVPFEAIHFANETTGYAVGWGGMILKNSTGNMENLSVNEFNKKDFVLRFFISDEL